MPAQMEDRWLDVLLEVSKDDLDARQADSGQIMLDKLRRKADEMVAEVRGAELVTDGAKHELIVREAEHRLTGEQCYLIATRWRVRCPVGSLPRG